MKREERIQRYIITEVGLKNLLDALLEKQDTPKNRTMLTKALRGNYATNTKWLVMPGAQQLAEDAKHAGYSDISARASDFYHSEAPQRNRNFMSHSSGELVRSDSISENQLKL